MEYDKVTRNEILMGRDKDAPLNDTQKENLEKLHKALNIVRKEYGKPLMVSSGYRPPAKNAQAGGASNSAHMTLEACDFRDAKGEFARWCLKNPQILKDAGLYMEDPRWTMTKQKDGSYAGWTHLQIRKTKKRYFIPYDPSRVPSTSKDFWTAIYDAKWD